MPPPRLPAEVTQSLKHTFPGGYQHCLAPGTSFHLPTSCKRQRGKEAAPTSQSSIRAVLCRSLWHHSVKGQISSLKHAPIFSFSFLHPCHSPREISLLPLLTVSFCCSSAAEGFCCLSNGSRGEQGEGPGPALCSEPAAAAAQLSELEPLYGCWAFCNHLVFLCNYESNFLTFKAVKQVVVQIIYTLRFIMQSHLLPFNFGPSRTQMYKLTSN